MFKTGRRYCPIVSAIHTPKGPMFCDLVLVIISKQMSSQNKSFHEWQALAYFAPLNIKTRSNYFLFDFFVECYYANIHTSNWLFLNQLGYPDYSCHMDDATIHCVLSASNKINFRLYSNTTFLKKASQEAEVKGWL